MKASELRTATSGWSKDPDPEAALHEIFGPDGLADASLGIVFGSAEYDLDALGEAVARQFPCPVIGCSTAGEICRPGYREQGVAAAVLRGVEAHVELIEDIATFGPDESDQLVERLGAKALAHADQAVLITLFDGLCLREEWLSSQLYMATGGVPMVGGSAGDALSFDNTRVYHNGKFRSGIGSCALVRSTGGIRTFIGHHYEDTGEVLVVTRAEPERRKIIELNGIPAVAAYASALGVEPEKLSKVDELLHPLMLNAGDRFYVRGVQQLLDDGAMQLFCAIDEGVVLRVGKACCIHDKLETVLSNACVGVDPQLVLMFDCITRRLEVDHTGSRKAFTNVVSGFPSIGFSTYGEQYNGVHVNQTVTGVVFGDLA